MSLDLLFTNGGSGLHDLLFLAAMMLAFSWLVQRALSSRFASSFLASWPLLHRPTARGEEFINDVKSTPVSPSNRSADACSSSVPDSPCSHDPRWWGPVSEDFDNCPYNEAGLLEVQGRLIPWTWTAPNYSDAERCYTVSIYAHFIGYGRDTADAYLKHSPVLRGFAHILLDVFDVLFRIAKLDECIFFNNMLLSTNLWPSNIHWTPEQVEEINRKLMQKKSNNAVAWRSVDQNSQPELTRALFSESSCLMIPFRTVNYFDHDKVKSFTKNERRNVKVDYKLFSERVGWDLEQQKPVQPGGENSVYELVIYDNNTVTLEVCKKVVYELYNKLYMVKYSRRNPQVNPQGLYRMVETGFLRLFVLRKRSDPSCYVAASTSWILDNVVAYPICGYDTESQDKCLYRLMMLLIRHEMFRNGITQEHMSGGANAFKRNRGAITKVEYVAVFVDHLPLFQRYCWRALKAVAEKIITVKRAK